VRNGLFFCCPANAILCTSATKPVEKTEKKKTDGGFKTAPDGRLIITESSDDEGKTLFFSLHCWHGWNHVYIYNA